MTLYIFHATACTLQSASNPIAATAFQTHPLKPSLVAAPCATSTCISEKAKCCRLAVLRSSRCFYAVAFVIL